MSKSPPSIALPLAANANSIAVPEYPADPAPAVAPTPLFALRQGIPASVYWSLAAVGLLAPIVLWILAVASGRVEPVFLPGPAKVIERVQVWWADGLLGDIGISTMRVVVGWALASLIALPLGLLIGSWRVVQALLEPMMDFIRYMPAVAFVPLVMVWVGIDEGAKVAIIFIGTFFPMVLMVAEDTRRVPMAQIEAAQTMGATRWEIVEKVILPSAKPALLDTLRVNMGCAWTYLVVAELVAANSGLGYAILKAQRFLQTDKIFAGILIIGLIGLVIDQLFRLAHRKAFPYMHTR
ncbi:MAG: ABC transporter permease [Pseudomonadota bacterium]|uniref:ABC transporter permease n=1 Tax=Aquabacterium sp. TaxID=1872578 RepID=UPI003BAF3DB2